MGIKDPFITTLVVQGKNKVMLLLMIFCSVNEYLSEITVFSIL